MNAIILVILLLINAGYSALTEKIQMKHESLRFKVGDKIRIKSE